MDINEFICINKKVLYTNTRKLKKDDMINELIEYKNNIDYQDYNDEDKKFLINKYVNKLKQKRKDEIAEEVVWYRYGVLLANYNLLMNNISDEGYIDTNKIVFDATDDTFTFKPEYLTFRVRPGDDLL